MAARTTNSCPPSCALGSTQDGGGTGSNSGAKGIGSTSYTCSGENNSATGVWGSSGPGGKAGDGEDWGTPAWGRGDPLVTGNTGQGGRNDKSNCSPIGSGGGGYGGGAVGNGAGGGGSFAAKSTATPPSQGTHRGGGFLTFEFALQ